METDRLLRELTDFLRIPSVSTLPAHNADCRAAAEWVAGELRRLRCREVQFLESGTHPVVWGVGPDVPGAPTLLLYGHYQVQPPDPLAQWAMPPLLPTVRDGTLFALRSGELGGAAPNAHEELVRLLARAKAPDGKIHVPGLYAAVRRPSKAELATWRSLPFKQAEFLKHRVQARALTGLKEYSVLERLWALPTFEIHGIMGGFTGDGAKTVIPAEAKAKVSLRLVPDQKLKVVERQLTAAVKRLAPKYVQASIEFLHGADPATVKVTHPAFKLLDQAFREVVGRGTVPARAGGSIPVVPALGRSGAPVI